MPTNLTTRHTQSTKAHLNFGCHPGHLPLSLPLPQHVKPDVKGNIEEGRGSPNNERHTTSPNLILQQMAKCNLWPWQIAVLVKPQPSSIHGKVRKSGEGGWEEWKKKKKRGRETKIGEADIWDGKVEKLALEFGLLNLTDLQRRSAVATFRGQTVTCENSRERCQQAWKAN